jgi:DUF971 family protein
MQAPQAIDYYAPQRRIQITWTPQHISQFSTRELRCACSCAGCVDEHTGQRILDPATVPDDIDVLELSAVGSYAIRFLWSDGHDTGIYSWDHLASLCTCPACRG